MTWLRANAPLVIIALCFGLRVALALGTDIYPDEAYYWTWSQRPQLGYFDHPGMIAWSIAILGIRTGALFWGVVTLFGVHRLTERLGGTREQAWWATALFASTPAAALLGTLSTPDAPLLAFWVWALFALVSKRPVLTGLLWGLAMLSKYNGILLGLPVLIVFFRRPLHLALATLIALAVTSPTIIWNSENDWEGFSFQIWHGLTYGGGGFPTFLEFLGGQFLMGGPVLVLLMLFWIARERAELVLKVSTALPILFFGYASWKARGEANWTAAAWLSASVGVAMTRFSRWKVAAVVSNVAVLTVGTLVLVFPPRALWTLPPVQKLHGWSVLQRAERAGVPVLTNRYQLSALISYYAHLPAGTIGGRRSQYDYWPTPAIPRGTDALWIDERVGPPPEFLERFESWHEVDWSLDERQRALHHFHVVRLERKK